MQLYDPESFLCSRNKNSNNNKKGLVYLFNSI